MKMPMVDQATFKTSDLALAAVLSIWFPLDSVDKIDPRKAQFIFSGSEELGQLVSKYWRRELEVEPQAFFGQLKIIKARLYAE